MQNYAHIQTLVCDFSFILLRLQHFRSYDQQAIDIDDEFRVSHPFDVYAYDSHRALLLHLYRCSSHLQKAKDHISKAKKEDRFSCFYFCRFLTLWELESQVHTRFFHADGWSKHTILCLLVGFHPLSRHPNMESLRFLGANSRRSDAQYLRREGS